MMRHPIIEEDLAVITQFKLPWEEFEGKTVLITGANGLLPAYMVETLLYLNERRHRVATQIIGLVRNIDKARTRFAAYQNRSDLRFIVQDVSTPIEIDVHVDYIVHAASQASPKYYGEDPIGTLSANVLGTHYLLLLAQKNRVRSFLFFSSSEIYGKVDQDPINELGYGYLDPAEIRSCYAEGKRIGETMCVAFAHQASVPAKIVRPFHTYGPGLSLYDGRVFADFIADIVCNRHIVMKSDGSAIRSFCYLADAVMGFFTILLRGETGQAYNIGYAESGMTIQELANMLVTLFPEKNLSVIRDEKTHTAGYLQSKISCFRPDITKIRQLGWQPTTVPEVGFARTIRSFE